MKKYVFSLTGLLLLIGAIFTGPLQQKQQPPPDNTKTNQGDANKGATTADQQKMGPVDSYITREIRSSIMKDKSLSTYAHNIKIISREGMVTLKGPVRFEAERTAIEAKAREIAGASNVTNKLTIATPEQ
jgi:osmotically-inducible protein OsmY